MIKHWKKYRIWCDDEDCDSFIDVEHTNKADALDLASQEGWQIVLNADFCPDCVPGWMA